MRSKYFEWLSALISAATVTLIAAYYAGGLVKGLVNNQAFLVTTFGAVAAAVAAGMTIWVSRRQTRLRERRRVFIVYAAKDVETATRLYQKMKGAGFVPWMDKMDIAPGEIWQRAVYQALEQSSAAIVLVSANLKTSDFAQKELMHAMRSLQEQRKDVGPIIPVRIDDSPIPDQLAHIQHADFRTEEGWQRLRLGLERVFGLA